MVAESAARASLIGSLVADGAEGPPPDGPLHLGVLLGNVPEYVFWLGAAALAGSVVVGINPTRRGEALAGDIVRTDCSLLVTDREGAALLDGLSFGVPPELVLLVDTPAYAELVAVHGGADPAKIVDASHPTDGDLYLLLFTSGTTGDPKAVRCTQGRLASIAIRSADAYGFERDDVAYSAMPLFHGNALMVLWGPTLVVGGTVALAPGSVRPASVVTSDGTARPPSPMWERRSPTCSRRRRPRTTRRRLCGVASVPRLR